MTPIAPTCPGRQPGLGPVDWHPYIVMPGLGPGIHELPAQAAATPSKTSRRTASSRRIVEVPVASGKLVDARPKAWHDDRGAATTAIREAPAVSRAATISPGGF